MSTHDGLKRPGLSGGWIPRHGFLWRGDLTVVLGFELDWRDVAEVAVEPVVVEPVDPAQVRVATSSSSTVRNGPS
jgi:hypothetical protein